jgi:hypothetical protein
MSSFRETRIRATPPLRSRPTAVPRSLGPSSFTAALGCCCGGWEASASGVPFDVPRTIVAMGGLESPRGTATCRGSAPCPAWVPPSGGGAGCESSLRSDRWGGSASFSPPPPGFNRAVIALCEQAGFEAHTVPDPQGPMAWETAVRLDGQVGVTARSAAVSSARNLRLIELRDEFTSRFSSSARRCRWPHSGRWRGPSGRWDAS